MVKICALGAASQDVFVSGKGIHAQLDPRTNEYMEAFSQDFKLGAKITVDTVQFATGGGATNAAVTFSRQDIVSSFIGKLGNDIAAHGVLEALDKENVNTQNVIYHESLGTQYSTVLLADNGERTILVYRGAANSHTPEDYGNIDFDEYDWLYVSSFAGAMDALDVIFDRAKSSGVKIAFNPGEAELNDPDKLRGLLESVDVLVMNKEEAAKVVEGETSEELARHALHYVRTVVVSDGPNGVVATDGKTVIIAGMYEDVPVLDRTGAGDAFGSGFLAYYSQGHSLKESVVFASANSTSVVQKIGAKDGILHKGTVLHDMPITEKEF
jgi:sugar/nucleoside kinase (ribokinase family)